MNKAKTYLFNKISIFLYLAIFIFPFLSYTFSIIHSIPLAGIAPVKKASVSISSLTSGAYQFQMDKYYLQKSGLWSWLVYLENTVNYHLFGISGTNSSTTTLIGNDRSLFDKIYINDKNGIYRTNTKNIDSAIEALKILKSELSKKNIPLIILIHPNKAIFKPDWVSWWLTSSSPAVRYVDSFIPKLKESKIDYIQIGEYFDDQHQYFSKSGAHMTDYGKCTSARLLTEKLNNLIPGISSTFNCNQSYETQKPDGEDIDLVRLLNAKNIYSSTERIRVNQLLTQKDSKVGKLNLYISGTSYCLGILEKLREAKSYTSATLVFYNKSSYQTRFIDKEDKYSGGQSTFNPKFFSLDFMLKFDAVVIEATEARLHQLGFGLLDQFKSNDLDTNFSVESSD